MNAYDNYDYVITKPELNEETLMHYGVKGMKWRKLKGRIQSLKTKASRKKKGMRPEEVSYNNGAYGIGITDDGKANSRTKTQYGNQKWGQFTINDIGGLSDKARRKNPAGVDAYDATMKNYYKTLDGKLVYDKKLKKKK